MLKKILKDTEKYLMHKIHFGIRWQVMVDFSQCDFIKDLLGNDELKGKTQFDIFSCFLCIGLFYIVVIILIYDLHPNF